MTLGSNGYLFVPDEGFTSVVTISAPSTARTGAWIPLRATRRNGPWKQVRAEEATADEMSLLEPRIFEPDVARNLTWIVEPAGIARFDAPSGEDTDPEPMTRMVMFSAPGTYTLRGYSAFPLQVSSNVLTIVVEESLDPPSPLDQLRSSRWLWENWLARQPVTVEPEPMHPRYSPAPFTADDVLTLLDSCRAENPCWLFIDLEHPYVYTANSRLTLYADQQRWAIVSEVSGYSDRAARFTLQLNYFGNCLLDLPRAGADGRYTHNMVFITLLGQESLAEFMDRFGSDAAPVIDVPLRNRAVQVPGTLQGFRTRIADIESRRWPVGVQRQDLGRYVAYEYADLCRATDTEKRTHLPQDLPELMTIDEWHHRSNYDYAPSSYETFRLIAEVLATRDPQRYRPTLAANNHWSNWPAAGSL